MGNYCHEKCDLCGSHKAKILIRKPPLLGMTSDSRIVQRSLHKLECENCGLIRDGNDFSDLEAVQHYKNEYTLNNHLHSNEHIFYKDGIAIPRSVAIANWMKDLIDKVIKEPLLKIYEVGAGQGSLLAQLKKMFPDTEFSGCEMNENAVIKAKDTGLSIVQGDYFAIDGKYDLIISFGVLEHVESPYDFLSYLRNHLNDHGYLLIGQPMQDVASYDIFFVDHLHHFHTSHIELLAKRAGFDQVGISSSPWFASNFSLHLLQKNSSKTNLENIVYIPTKAYDSLTYWNNVFREIDLISQNDSNVRDNYAIYGLGEIATLLYCYGGLNKLNISIGIDDNPERYKQNIFDIPVKKIEDLSVEDKDKVIAVLLTCNFMYYSYLIEKCTKSRLSTIKILK